VSSGGRIEEVRFRLEKFKKSLDFEIRLQAIVVDMDRENEWVAAEIDVQVVVVDPEMETVIMLTTEEVAVGEDIIQEENTNQEEFVIQEGNVVATDITEVMDITTTITVQQLQSPLKPRPRLGLQKLP
jgi:hypothetical protein